MALIGNDERSFYSYFAGRHEVIYTLLTSCEKSLSDMH